MRQIIGWIAIIVIALAVAVLMSVWGSRNKEVLSFTANIGGLAIGVFVATLVGWFFAPLLEQEEKDD